MQPRSRHLSASKKGALEREVETTLERIRNLQLQDVELHKLIMQEQQLKIEKERFEMRAAELKIQQEEASLPTSANLYDSKLRNDVSYRETSKDIVKILKSLNQFAKDKTVDNYIKMGLKEINKKFNDINKIRKTNNKLSKYATSLKLKIKSNNTQTTPCQTILKSKTKCRFKRKLSWESNPNRRLICVPDVEKAKKRDDYKSSNVQGSKWIQNNNSKKRKLQDL
ncbi:hypothetical protein FQR65_LT10048 [Abscondita terminalis]|nr:hypothetical protein FQR65_LT10048 [Abscondita terminalis]